MVSARGWLFPLLLVTACGTAAEPAAPEPVAPPVVAPPPAPPAPPPATIASFRLPSTETPNGNTCFEFGGRQWRELAPYEDDAHRARAARDLCRRTSSRDCQQSGTDYADYMRVAVPCEEGATATCLLVPYVRYHYGDNAEMIRLYRLDCEREHGVWHTL